MIKTVVKRDGTQEDFSANKLNRWGKWAAKSLHYVDWPTTVMEVVATLPEVCTTGDLQQRLIKHCLNEDSWSYNKMAGRLYAPMIYKEAFGSNYKDIPTVRSVQEKLVSVGLMVDMDYSSEEYEVIEDLIDHSRDFDATHFELHQVKEKYSIKDVVAETLYETQQFVYMRMAMALAAERFTGEEKLKRVESWYNNFSNKRLNAPTPNFVNLGTPLKGYASCCLHTTNDDIHSLSTGDHIAYEMTGMSAGIGAHLKTRSKGDPVRGGRIKHLGKLPYYRSLVGAIGANMQAGRGGAATMSFTCFDPEVEVLLELKNPMSTEDKKIRGLDYSLGSNKVFARAVARDEEVALFSYADEPELYEAQYAGDQALFSNLYSAYLLNTKPKVMVRARDLAISSLTEAYETGRSYLHFFDEMNRNSPFKEAIYQSNLCLEVSIPTKGYNNVKELYCPKDSPEKGEIGLCSLAAINVGEDMTDEEYASLAYDALEMIDICIDLSDHVFDHLEMTAKARRNAGVGMVGVAYLMAKNKMKYSTQEGKDFLHSVAETHAWHVYNASLKLGKKYGNAPWMHKTKWPDGWLPTETYNKSVDGVVTTANKRDWESLRKDIMANGGIRNSSCINFMPSESSSKASGTTNGVYPVRDLTLIKTDETTVSYWAAPEGERLSKHYEFAWDVPTHDMIDCYAIIQKFCDQTISADLFRKIVGSDTVTTEEMLTEYLYMIKMGMKTRYYQNSKTNSGKEISSEDDDSCAGGSCKL